MEVALTRSGADTSLVTSSPAAATLWLGVGVTRPARLLAVPLLCVVALAGCSKSGSGGLATPTVDSHASSTLPTGGTTGTASSTTPAATASTGSRVTSRSGGFSVVPAPGWSVATDRAPEVAGLDLVLLSSDRVGSFNANLVVIASEGDQARADAELARGRVDLGSKGTVTEIPPKQIAGETAKGIATAFTEAGAAVLVRSYAMHHDGAVYLLTLSSSQTGAGQAMDELDTILASWTWT